MEVINATAVGRDLEDNERLLELLKEAKTYGWRLSQGPQPVVATRDGNVDYKFLTVAPPTETDPRNNWAGIWKNVPVVENGHITHYVSFPHWFEREIIDERTRRNVSAREAGGSSSGKTSDDETNVSWSEYIWNAGWARFVTDGFISPNALDTPSPY